MARRKRPEPTHKVAPSAQPAVLTPEGLLAFQAELDARRQALLVAINGCAQRVKQAQEEATRLVGELNQVAGQILAVDRMLGKTHEPKAQAG